MPGKQFEDMLAPRVQLWLYRWAFDRGHLDTILDRWVIDPLLQVSRLFAKLDHIGVPGGVRRPTGVAISVQGPAEQGGD